MKHSITIHIHKNNKTKNIFEYFNTKFISSRKLYNQGLYLKKLSFRAKVYIPNFYCLNNLFKNNENYRNLKAQTSQQILKQLEQDFSSFYSSIKSWKKNKNKLKEIINIQALDYCTFGSLSIIPLK